MPKKEVKKKKDKEEVCEIFDVEKGGKEKQVVSCEDEKIGHATNTQMAEQNKVLKWILIGIGIFIIAFLATLFYIENTKHFSYEGINFEKIKEGEITFYKTSFPVSSELGEIMYNVYIRNDPRQLEKVQSDVESINLREMMIVNTTDDFVCDGDGSIAMINFAQVMKPFGVKVGKDANATCDPYGRYVFIEIDPANETRIVQDSETCYTMYVSNCEILKVTEKFMLDKLVEIIPKLGG